MPEVLNAMLAFVAEHQRCGDLDGGRDGGYIWLGCSGRRRNIAVADCPGWRSADALGGDRKAHV